MAGADSKYQVFLTIDPELKGIPYGGRGEVRDDGDANYGFKNLKGKPALLDEIPELVGEPALRSLVEAINSAETGVVSIGCVAGDVAEQNGFRRSGYIEVSWNSETMIADAAHYFPLFYHFERMLRETGFDSPVHFLWELKPAHFIDQNVTGFTCPITINTHFSATADEASADWDAALGALEFFFSGIPVQEGRALF